MHPFKHTADVEVSGSMICEHGNALLIKEVHWRALDDPLNKGQSLGESGNKPCIVSDVVADHVFGGSILFVWNEAIAAGNQLTDSACVYYSPETSYWQREGR